jgi:AraC-like DNA-binding protein
MGIHMGVNLAQDVLSIATPRFLIGLSALYGPSLFLHIRSLQKLNFAVSKKTLLHFVLSPVAVIASFLMPDHLIIIRIVILIQVYAYLVKTLLSVFEFKKVIKLTQTNNKSINLNWASNLIVCFLIISVVDLVNTVFNFLNPTLSSWGYLALLVSLLAFVNLMFFKALVQPKLFRGISNEDELIYRDSLGKYQGSDLTEQDIINYKAQIDAVLVERKPYLEPNLTISQLSEMVGISSRIVSQVINSTYTTNFSDFINDQRLEEAKMQLIKYKDKSVLEILYAVGFNSKSAFYDIFKLKTGVTPKDFRKN